MARIRENNFMMDFEDTGLQPSLQQFISAPQINTDAIARQQIEAQIIAQQEAQARAQIAAQQRAYEEQVYRQTQARQEELRAQNVFRLAQEQESARQAQLAQERAQLQAIAQAEAQARAQLQAIAQAQAQARAQAEQQARAQAEAQARAQAEQQARAQAEAQARVQAEQQARAQAEAQARVQAEAIAQTRAEALRAQNIARLAQEQQAQLFAEQEAARQVFNQRQAQQPTTLEQAINQISAQAPQQPTMSTPPMATDKTSIIDNLIKQIQARSNTAQWSGGVGADQATKDMARILAETGITDISQFGPITREVEKIVGYEDTGEPIYRTVTEQTFGNKETGQVVPTTYSERQKGDFFGGTFEGKGNTGYGVQFDAQGNPSFFTQGASSRDPIVKAALPIGALALGAYGAQSLFGGALGGATPPVTEAAIASGGFPLTSLVPETSALASGAGGGLLSGAAPSLASAAPEIVSSSFDLANAGIAGGTSAFTTAQLAAIEAAQAAGAGGLLSSAAPAAIASSVASAAPAVASVAPAVASAVAPIVASTVAPAAASTGLLSSVIPALGTVGGALASGALSSLGGALGNVVTGGLGNLISGGLGTAGNLLQMKESREAAQKAQAMIERETEAAKQAAQFRPVGMTTRFGTSEFKVDPTTGQLISAGYTLSPEAKAQQDRLVALQNQGLTQAEQAQAQFAPLQTGAQRLFGLGNQYLAQSPEQVAQNYMNQQLALLQPGRELELANLQNRLQQQGRQGLSVAQGGSYGATTPELQALYNARAMQEAQLAAQAQQAGQQQVQFGAGLLGQGAGVMGQYYGGQQAAYAPYTTASGQVQGLEALGQQPLTMGTNLGQQAAQAGANVGRLGLTGAQLSTNLATSADATRNLLAQTLIGAGNPNAMFGQTLGGLLGGGARALFSQTPLGGSGFGTGLAYNNQDIGQYI